MGGIYSCPYAWRAARRKPEKAGAGQSAVKAIAAGRNRSISASPSSSNLFPSRDRCAHSEIRLLGIAGVGGGVRSKAEDILLPAVSLPAGSGPFVPARQCRQGVMHNSMALRVAENSMD